MRLHLQRPAAPTCSVSTVLYSIVLDPQKFHHTPIVTHRHIGRDNAHALPSLGIEKCWEEEPAGSRLFPILMKDMTIRDVNDCVAASSPHTVQTRHVCRENCRRTPPKNAGQVSLEGTTAFCLARGRREKDWTCKFTS